jgi:uncharacterized RDD family membrane protein YckC
VSRTPPDAPTKVLVRRYLAHLIDLLVHVSAVVIPALLLATRHTIDDAPQDLVDAFPRDFQRVDSFDFAGDRVLRLDDQILVFEPNELLIIAGIAAAVTLFFQVIVQGRAGWTIGKALTGIRTVNKDGDRPGILRALLRTILLAIDAIPSYVLPLVGGASILASSENRRLGDLVAGTYVVRRSAMGDDPTVVPPDHTGWPRSEEHPGHVTTLAKGEPLRVGDAAPEPVTASAPVAAVPTAQGEGGGEKAPAYQPQWDPTRKAYLQWDPRKQVWLQFDDAAGEWRPI